MSEAYAFEDEDQEQEQEPSGFDLLSAIRSPNIAFDLEPGVLDAMGSKVIDEFKLDEDSRKDWKVRYDKAMKLALQATEAKNVPWANASNVKHPLLSTAAIQFNARAYPAIIDGPEVVKGSIKGRPSPEKEARADRIGKHMSYQLLEEMDDWEEDTDRLLMQLPIVGCAFRKTWFDPLKGYNCSNLVSAADFVVNYWTKDLASCPRATHVLTFYPHEVQEKMRSGLWLTVDLGRPAEAANDDQAPHTFYEQYRLWDLDDDGYPEPYIITAEKESGKVVRVVARFDERGVSQAQDGSIIRIVANQTFTKYPFIPAPDGSFYDIGFGTLLYSISGSIDTVLNQLFDAGALANLQSGFIGEGLSIRSGNMAFRPGEWRKVGTSGGMIKDNIVPLPTKEPSSVLFSLLGFLVEAAKDVTATQDILGGDAGRGSLPVGTVSALIEQGLKTFTAIVKRIHRALKKELGIIYQLNGRYLEPEVYFTFQDQEGAVAQDDYAQGDMDVVPVSDPNMATDMQRMQQAQFVMEVGKGTGAIPPRKIAEVALKAARVPDIEDLLGPEQQPAPDPKAIEAQAKAENAAHQTDIAAAEAVASIAKTNAETEQLQAQTMMMGPDLMAQVEQYAREKVREALEMVMHGGQPGPVQQQGPVPGMAEQPPNGALPPVPGGPAGGADGQLGPGGPDVAGGPMQGGFPPGAEQPGLG